MAAAACDRAYSRADSVAAATADTMGTVIADVRLVPLRARTDLVENSAAAMSATQPGVLFTINDSGNEPLLYAVDTSGADRGAWTVRGARDVDWESVATAACTPGGAERCVFIGDTGDNAQVHSTHVIYRVREPAARDSSFTGSVEADSLIYTYPDGRHDVEAMYVAPNGDVFLITKRAWRLFRTRLRPAIVYRIPYSAWSSHASIRAERADSLPIYPGSAPLRVITDASLAPDARHLAVRTYMQVYIVAKDSASGRVRHDVSPAVCNIVSLGEPQGEGITWANNTGRLVFSSEGRTAPLHIGSCPLPAR
jgi:hypothetical protein